MTVTLRPYHHPQDYSLVDRFLIDHYRAENRDGNWLEPAWEYMHAHPMLDCSVLHKIGIWEEGGRIVAIATYESRLGEVFFQFHPHYRYLREEMLDYAEDNLSDQQPDGGRVLRAYVNDTDEEFTALVQRRGYQMDEDWSRPLAILPIPDPFPSISLPDGFVLKSLAEECDWAKVHRVMWRGFNNEGEPPAGEEELASRQRMFDTPTARRDLKIVVQAPNGDFASICGMFYEPVNRYAYVEPVATDPAYRRMGCGRAAVMEGIRRCGELGATVAYVGSDQPFYLSLGFRVIYTSRCWKKEF